MTLSCVWVMDPLLFGGAVREGLGHGLGGGLDAVHNSRAAGGHGVHHVPHSLHGLVDRPLAVRRDGLHGLDVLEHAVHHLAAGGGDDLLLLGRAVGQRFGDSLGRGGHAVLDCGGGVADGFDDVRRGLFCALGGRDGGSCRSGGSCRRAGRAGTSGRVSLRLCDPLIVLVEAALACLISFRLLIAADRVGIGLVVGIFCCTEAVFQRAQSGGCTLDAGHQLIDPVHHRTDDIRGCLLNGRKC